MLTRCSYCQAWFRVRAEHLSAAAGMVTCGQCDAVFNALETLVEEQLPPPVVDGLVQAPTLVPSATTVSASTQVNAALANAARAAGAQQAAARERADQQAAAQEAAAQEAAAREAAAQEAAGQEAAAQEAAAQEAAAQEAAAREAAAREAAAQEAAAREAAAQEAAAREAAAQEAAAQEAAAQEAELRQFAAALSATDRASDEPTAEAAVTLDFEFGGEDKQAPVQRLTAEDHAILFTKPGSQLAASASNGTHGDGIAINIDDEDVPPVLAAEFAALAYRRPDRSISAALWAGLAFTLLLAALAQSALVLRTQVVELWPRSQSLFDRVCARLPCHDEQMSGSAVQLIARDVREHPQYHNALLVNATMVNTSAGAQPFPVLELRLRDGVGSLIGARRFAPAEYLDDSISIADGMLSKQPVYIVMEIGGDAARATSFEFNFL